MGGGRPHTEVEGIEQDELDAEQVAVLLRPYPDILHYEEPGAKWVFNHQVEVQEKVDGSFISFGVINGELQIRSKRTVISGGNNRFLVAEQEIRARESLLWPGAVYYGEYLEKPKHSHLCYKRIPAGHIVIYDILVNNIFMQHQQRASHILTLGWEPVRVFGVYDDCPDVVSFLGQESQLEGVDIEGVVLKGHNERGDRTELIVKYVSPKFKEVHSAKHKSGGSPARQLGSLLRTEARWRKSIQHLDDEGILRHNPEDISFIIKEIHEDIEKEQLDRIKADLWKAYRVEILRTATRGVAEFYKQQLGWGVSDEVKFND